MAQMKTHYSNAQWAEKINDVYSFENFFCTPYLYSYPYILYLYFCLYILYKISIFFTPLNLFWISNFFFQNSYFEKFEFYVFENLFFQFFLMQMYFLCTKKLVCFCNKDKGDSTVSFKNCQQNIF